MATSATVVQPACHRGLNRRGGSSRQFGGLLPSPILRLARDLRPSSCAKEVIGRTWYRVMVVRGDRVIDWRDAPAELAEAYARVLGLLYPADKIRTREISRHEAAYPRDRPYDPRD